LESILSREVEGNGGQVEDSLARVMRHTQLLPRHLLRILNGIMQRNAELGEPATAVSPEAVIDGVWRVQEPLVAEMFTAYGSVHALARDACGRLIPDLPTAFSEGYPHRQLNRTGIRKNVGLSRLPLRLRSGPRNQLVASPGRRAPCGDLSSPTSFCNTDVSDL
jgi:hypothetical protein